ncbi:hypothetical protein TKK_0015478 [Trichogramma kaykai]
MSSFEKIYFSPTHPAAYAGATRLKRHTRKRYTGNTISSWLEQHDAYNLHTPVIRKFPRRCYNVRNIDDVWEADLIDWRSLKTYNDNYTYLLVIIDALSKYAWVEPLKDKIAKSVSMAFERVFRRRHGRLPVLLQTDKGEEFVSHETLTLFKKKKYTTSRGTQSRYQGCYRREIHTHSEGTYLAILYASPYAPFLRCIA